MLNKVKGFCSTQAAVMNSNPYAIQVVGSKRSELKYGIWHTEDLLDHLVTEGVVTQAKRSVVLNIRTREEQNSMVLDIMLARGERACRKFFHPCLMQAEPKLYNQIKAYLGSANEKIGDPRRQLIGYLLERDKEGLGRKPQEHYTQKIQRLSARPDSFSAFQNQARGARVSPEKIGRHELKEHLQVNIYDIIAAGGEPSVVEKMLNHVDVNAVNSLQESLLHVAAEHGHLSLLGLLLRRGARLELRDQEGRTPLHRAANRDHGEVVRALMKAGACLYTLDAQRKNPVHLTATNEDLDCARALLMEERGRGVEDQTEPTFLHRAAQEEDQSLAQKLLQAGAAVDVRTRQDKTALFYAVSGNNERTAGVLLEAGAAVDQVVLNEAVNLNNGSMLRLLLAHSRGALSPEAMGSTLFSAVKQNCHAVVDILIDGGADVNMCDQQGYTPLLLAAELGHTDTFRVLAGKNAKLDVSLPNLATALHLAVRSGSELLVQALLAKGLDPNATGPKAYTPLHLAALHSHPALVEMLLKAEAQANAVAQDGSTPLHLASRRGHADTLNRLLQVKVHTEIRDRQGRTALHWAASTQTEGPAVDMLLSAGANPDAADKQKKTPLHLAAAAGQTEAVAALFTHKARVGAKDMHGSTPLHYAAGRGHDEAVKLLLSAQKKHGVDQRNTWRKTPLHTAAEKGHTEAVASLLRAGAKVNTLDNCKDTPLHCAVRAGSRDAVRELVSWEPGKGRQGGKADLQAVNNVGKTPLQVAESEDTQEHRDIVAIIKRKMVLIK
ncbi:CARD- and ANK-domain containing inflammasome adapter protein [Gadus macrocephalus]|uniref:CARD- and ANK-domain containing inflammasome adapter protein n=1 Tax=Gadus macrocephalus TaxID=80720 RepID=UPI0028CBBE96|nr:CARD- and ANK-domain containing inflammasome adapter protein [Gadus macrocephalus]